MFPIDLRNFFSAKSYFSTENKSKLNLFKIIKKKELMID